MKFFIPGLLATLFSVSLNAQWLGFRVKQQISVDKRLYSFTLAQSNDDAFRDLIALPFEAYSNGQIFRGDKSENFAAPLTFQKQDQYRLLNVADLDDDGIDDLIISSYWGNGFRIYWGSDDGTYTEGQHYGLTGHGKNLIVEDMDNDGALDVAALSGGSGQPITLHLFRGENSRTITPAGIFSSELDTDTRITILDKNKDGLKDIMVASSFPWFVIFYQQPGGNYKPQYWPWDVDFSKPFTSEYYVADFNNDSKEDLLAFYFDEGFRLYEGLQDTLFTTTYQSIPTHSRLGRTFIADINGDGKNDIVMENYTPDYEPTTSFYYLLGNGDLTFSEPVPFNVGTPIERMIVDDLNVDGFPDVILYSSDQKLITVLNEGIVAGNEEVPIHLSTYPNPFDSQLYMKFASYPAAVKIFDSQGKLQKNLSLNEETFINTQDWPSGLYVVHSSQGKKTTTIRIVKD